MPSKDPPLASVPLGRVSVAQRAGSSPPTQDRVFATANAVIVLDGATQPEPAGRDGGWLAQELGTDLSELLTDEPFGDLADTLYVAIAVIADHYDLRPGRSPTTTVSIVRWTADHLDALVLGDSPIIVRTRDLAIHPVRDDRLAQVGDRDAYRAALANGTFDARGSEAMRALVEEQRAARNRPGGYWIAETVPDAAYQAVRARWPLADVSAVLVATDGVADGVDTYGVPPDWPAALTIATPDPVALVDLVHAAEERDPHGRRWPRSKPHDDKTAAVITFPGQA